MKLVWHMVAKDLRRMRIPLLLWSVVLIAKNEIGVNLWLGDASDLAHFDMMKAIAGVLMGLDAFVNMVLVALLVHEDAVVGTRQFWTTRPISSGRLLAAKLLGAALMFGVLPVVISLRLWWASDYGVAEMARAALLVWDGQILVVGFALVVATLTENMNRFLLGMFGGLILLYAWLGATMQFVGFRPDAGDVGRTRFALIGVLLMAAATIVVVRQFRRRASSRSLMALGVALLLATLVAGWWPWNWQPSPRDTTVAGAGKIQPTVTQAETDPSLGVRLTFRFEGLPKEFGLRGITWNTWALPGESVAVKAKVEPMWPTWAEWQALRMPADQFRGPEHRAAKFMARSERLRTPGQRPQPRGSDPEDEAQAVGFVDTSTLKRLAGESAPFRSELTLELFHPVASFEVALRTGERDGRDGWHARIAQAEFRDGLLFVRLVESRSLWNVRDPSRAGVSVFFRGLERENEERAYFQVNRAKGTAHPLGRRGGGFEANVPGQIIRWQTMTLGSPDQMKGAALAGIRYEPDGTLHREVKLDHLAVTPINP